MPKYNGAGTRTSANDTILQMTQDIVDTGAKTEDAGIFRDLAKIISAFDVSCFPDSKSPIFAVFGKNPRYIAQYISQDHKVDGVCVSEGYYIYFTGAYESLIEELPKRNHFMFDGLDVVTEPYTLSELLFLYGAHEVRHKVQEENGVLFKRGDAFNVHDPTFKTILSVLEKEAEINAYLRDEKEFDAETIGKYASLLVHEDPKNLEPRKIAAMIKARPQLF